MKNKNLKIKNILSDPDIHSDPQKNWHDHIINIYRDTDVFLMTGSHLIHDLPTSVTAEGGYKLLFFYLKNFFSNRWVVWLVWPCRAKGVLLIVSGVLTVLSQFFLHILF